MIGTTVRVPKLEEMTCGLSEGYNDLLEEGYSSEEAIKIIVQTEMLFFKVQELYPEYTMIKSTEISDGVNEVELERTDSLLF